MKKLPGWKSQIVSAFLLLVCVVSASAEGREGWVCGPDGCFAAIQETKYSGFDAWRLCDGKTEAIVVPAIGRVMSFKTETGQNWLWNSPAAKGKNSDPSVWNNWGGDKNWIAPQGDWSKLGTGTGWPPPKEWEQSFQSQVISGGKLKIWGPVSPVSGLRLSRVFYHNDKGEFVIEQTLQQVAGKPVKASIWSITQIDGAKTDAVFVARGENSDYDSGFRWMNAKPNGVDPKGVAPTLIQVIPTTQGDYKIGTDAPRAAIAAVHNGWAFVERASRPDGNYPDGTVGKNGTPVQLFGQGDPKVNYLEMELLSPLLQFSPGVRWTHTVRWSLHELPNKDVNDAKLHAAIDALLN